VTANEIYELVLNIQTVRSKGWAGIKTGWASIVIGVMYEENIRWQHKDFKPQKYMISFHAVYFIVIFVGISYYYFKKYQNRNISTYRVKTKSY
jgi:hypothetical protein